MNVAIVAIPVQDDYVWKISSEKVPHVTLLNLGNPPVEVDLAHVVSFLEHVVETSLCRFGLSVDRRGPLGDKDADVLFFSKEFGIDRLKEIQGYLLTDPNVSLAYNSAEQFPEWTPHLTLGYPDSPAHPDKRDYPGIGWVNFDRIALWTGDYDGPEFVLQSDNDYAEVSMSDAVDEFLAHYGVPGMRWGRRKGESVPDGVTQVTQKKPGGKLTTAGGKGIPAHPDAIAKAQAKQAAKGSGVQALSNKELQAAVQRMNLEQQYSRLTQTDSAGKRAQKVVKELLGIGKTYNEALQFQNSPAGKQLKEKMEEAKKPKPDKVADLLDFHTKRG